MVCCNVDRLITNLVNCHGKCTSHGLRVIFLAESLGNCICNYIYCMIAGPRPMHKQVVRFAASPLQKQLNMSKAPQDHTNVVLVPILYWRNHFALECRQKMHLLRGCTSIQIKWWVPLENRKWNSSVMLHRGSLVQLLNGLACRVVMKLLPESNKWVER